MDIKIKHSLFIRKLASIIPAKTFLSWKHQQKGLGRINWKDPVSFTEKCSWMKVYYHNPLLTQLADKIESKKYVEKILGPGYTFPLIATYERVEDIDYATLPNQFVIKCNHDSGSLCICKDKAKGIIVRGKSDDQRNLSLKEVNKILSDALKKTIIGQ